MLKWLAVIAIGFALCIDLSPRTEAQQRTNKTTQKGSDKSDPTSITYVDNRRSEAKADAAQNKPPEWYESPEWALVVVGIITFVIIGWQSCETRKAAEATRVSADAASDSVTLQVKAYEQWVILDNWKTEYWEQDSGPHQQRIWVDVVNQTDFPLLITEAALFFGRKTLLSGWGFADHFLPPKVPYTVMVDVSLNDLDVSQMHNGCLSVPVDGHITFVGVLKKPYTQSVRGRAQCGEKTIRFTHEIPMHPIPEG